jgi:hypothetical protein
VKKATVTTRKPRAAADTRRVTARRRPPVSTGAAARPHKTVAPRTKEKPVRTRAVAPTEKARAARIEEAKKKAAPARGALPKERVKALAKEKERTAKPGAVLPPATETKLKGSRRPEPQSLRVEGPPAPGARRRTPPHDRLPGAPEPAEEESLHEDAEALALEPDADLLDDALSIVGEVEIVLPESVEGLDYPPALLDADLAELPRPPAAPRPRSKLQRVERRPQQCAGCGGTFAWVSVEQLCFSCLKRKLSQRKREDETYTGYQSDVEDDEDNT